MKKKGFFSGMISGSSRAAEKSPAVPAAADNKLNIDYPQAGEKIQRGHYAIRISGSDGECHVSIDGGGWQSCRSDAGYSWYDWDAQPGSHHISARTRVLAKWVKAETTCDVE